MKPQEYLRTEKNLVRLARLATELDLDAFLAAAEAVERHVARPELACVAGEGAVLADMKRLARAARVFQSAAADVAAMLSPEARA